MNKWSVLLLVIGISLVLLSFGCSNANSVSWNLNFSNGEALAKKNGLVMMIGFYTKWCETCQKLDQTTFIDDKVKNLATKLVPIMVDAESTEGKIIRSRYAVSNYPTVVFAAPDGRELHRVVGYRHPRSFVNDVNNAIEKSKVLASNNAISVKPNPGTSKTGQNQPVVRPGNNTRNQTLSNTVPNQNPRSANQNAQSSGNNGESINWITDFKEGLKQAQAQNKPIMINFYTSWCGYCKKMDKTTFSHRDIVDFSKEFVCVKLNGSTQATRQIQSKYGVRGYPTIVFLDKEGELKEKAVGYRTTQPFIDIMKKVK